MEAGKPGGRTVKNFCVAGDPGFINLLQRIHAGIGYRGTVPLTIEQRGVGKNYKRSDFHILND